jgi:hypothetical protein
MSDNRTKLEDDQLLADHERYLEEVTQSGMPLWMYQQYYYAEPTPEDYVKEDKEDSHKDLPF